MVNPLAEDLDHILDKTTDLWDEVRGQTIFITGGTGFFGCWLLESFIWINDHLNLGASAVVLTRNPNAFKSRVPHLALHPSIRLLEGDVRSFSFPKGSYPFVIHAATDASASLNEEDPLLMFDTVVNGTRRVLEFASSHGARKFLLTSSGAVYGKQPATITHIPEDYMGAPDPLDPNSAYGEGKRAAELLCSIYAKTFGIEMKIARCFAFVGPYLPLDSHFAIGNFIRNAIMNKPIVVKGDGSPLRSYLYAADLAVWLWTILFLGKSGRAYNVGSSEIIAIAELAKDISQKVSPKVTVKFDQADTILSRNNNFIPSTAKAEKELNLRVLINRSDGINKTINWRKIGED